MTLRSCLLAGTALALPAAVQAQAPDTDTNTRRAALLRQRDVIDAELRALDDRSTLTMPARRSDSLPAEAGEIIVTGRALSLTTRVTGQTVTTVDDAAFRNTPATTIADIVKLSPGVAVIQGNGPRYVGVSVRGSNARNSFGARNIQVFEDDFPVTQPDGLARFDLTDPHAYGAVDAYGVFSLGDRDRVAGKVIYNEGDFRLSTRLSYDQYRANPYQRGCEAAATAARGWSTASTAPASARPRRRAVWPATIAARYVRQTAYGYPVGASPTITLIPAKRAFWNVAPEAALSWRAIDAVRLHARVGTGYGIPQANSLFITPAGTFGNNTELDSQTNTGVDVGAEIAVGRNLTAEVTGYYEWFRGELVSQSAGVDLLAFTANVPRSIHRGVEVGLDWRPLPTLARGARLQASYSYNDHVYTGYMERLTSGATSMVFDREGGRIPGVIPTFVNLRAAYDQPDGALAGLGGFAELTHRARYFIDNGNLLAVPGYTLVNANLHYDPPPGDGWWRRLSLSASVQNLFDTTYVGSASVIANSLDPATGRQNPAAVLSTVTGSIYAGQPRTVFVGIKSRFGR